MSFHHFRIRFIRLLLRHIVILVEALSYEGTTRARGYWNHFMSVLSVTYRKPRTTSLFLHLT
uniref:Uncharacterized protein n=1 Tax=Picea glauca TaxID=3330 RepID=A0A124GNW0_PICGL|nr:hypothetical protein ABT39_MTgene3275 [Picea glauca]QHR89215.1 hypothetical protein Q903MT_gene3235 [Picea sitchensis]